MSTPLNTRIERDSMGEMEVPVAALYGASTMRAVLNFPISGIGFPRPFIRALGLVKQSAAKTNMVLGLLDETVGNAIVAAAQEVVDGALDEHFVLDIFQTGSGTSTNTNANEVIANKASQILGGNLGSRLVHPNDHVNMGQSSNDVIPTSIHLAALLSIKEDLIPSLEFLAAELNKKSDEFWPIVKTGRTHLQDATPVRLGQEFKGFAGQAEYGVQRSLRAQEALAEVALGGTAVGTGVNTHEEFSSRTCQIISDMSGVLIKETGNHFQAQASLDGLVEASGELKTIAISLHKIANDIRFIASGLNTMMPVAAHNILQSIALLAASSHNFADQCVKGIKATTQGPDMVEKGLMLGTALAPAIGYDAAASIAKEASAKGTTIREMAKEKTELSDAELDSLLKPETMTEPGIGAGGPGGGG